MNIRSKRRKGIALVAAAVMASFVIFGGCSMGTAADNSVGGMKPAQAVDAAQDKAWIEARVNDPEKGPYTMRHVPKKPERDEKKRDERLPDLPSGDSGFGQLSRTVLVGGGIVLAFILLTLVAQHGRWQGGRRQAQKAEADSADLYILPDGKAPPRDAALEQWHAGNMIAALAVLYARLVSEPRRHQLPAFIRGESESEYLARAQTATSSAQQQFLHELFALWQRGVYGHETLAREAVRGVIERYLALWRGV